MSCMNFIRSSLSSSCSVSGLVWWLTHEKEEDEGIRRRRCIARRIELGKDEETRLAMSWLSMEVMGVDPILTQKEILALRFGSLGSLYV